MNSRHPELVVYVKEDCHLCDTLVEQLQIELAAADASHVVAEIRDIEDDPAWYREFREYVPVVVVDGEEICHYFFDAEAFGDAMTRVSTA